MQETPQPGTLSTGDALFLYFERQGQPVNVASVNVFEGVISLDDCVELIRSRLPLIPRYLQRVVAPPYNMDVPAWEYDPAFDIGNHVREVVMKHGTEAELKRIAGQVLSTSLDRHRPLWDFTVISGLDGGRTGAILRMHHCLADGIAGVGLMNVLMDQSPAPSLTQPPAPIEAPPQMGERSLFVDLISSSMSLVKRVLAFQSELLVLANQVVAAAPRQSAGDQGTPAPTPEEAHDSLMEKLARVLPEIAQPPERLPFNVVCRGPQKFEWGEIPLAELKAVKDACGATINDVVLTAVTACICRYAERHGVGLAGRRLRVIVPVNLRGDVKTKDFGNRITFLPVNIPMDIEDPLKLIEAVRTAVARVRGAHLPELVGFLGTWIAAIPSPVQAMVGPLISQLPVSLCNLICTNVPGPQVPLYFCGHKLLAGYPYVPIGGEMGMNCAVLTYNGTAYFGFTGDAHAIPDLALLFKFLRASFEELRKASGVVPVQRKRFPEKPRERPHEKPHQKPKPRRGRTGVNSVPVPAPSTKERSLASEPVALSPAPDGKPGEAGAAEQTAVAAAGSVQEFAETIGLYQAPTSVVP